jgi:signal transduction histidine kinase
MHVGFSSHGGAAPLSGQMLRGRASARPTLRRGGPCGRRNVAAAVGLLGYRSSAATAFRRPISRLRPDTSTPPRGCGKLCSAENGAHAIRGVAVNSPRAEPSPILPAEWGKGELRIIGVVVAVCCAAGTWSALQSGGSIAGALLVTNVIGLTQLSLATLVRVFFHGRLPPLGLMVAIPAGFVLGSKLASLTGVPDIAAQMLDDPQAMWETVFVGAVVTAFFLYFSHSREVSAALERERRRAAEALQAETAARLALLQAQIEPHFLFNTLANIHSLVKEDPDTASRILEQLNVYLRTSLRRTRQATTTVGEELDLVEALLNIASARLGARLTHTIVVESPELRAAALPPLLLQPLVENAIRHGIEPAVAGGTIVVDVRKGSGSLELTVTDTGLGLNPNAPEGVGLANVRDRLASLYGSDGKLLLYENVPCGVVAKLIVPTPVTA